MKVASSPPTSAFRSPTTADLIDTFLDNPNNSPPMVVENPNCHQASKPMVPQTGIQLTITRSGRTIVKPARSDDFVSFGSEMLTSRHLVKCVVYGLSCEL